MASCPYGVGGCLIPGPQMAGFMVEGALKDFWRKHPDPSHEDLLQACRDWTAYLAMLRVDAGTSIFKDSLIS